MQSRPTFPRKQVILLSIAFFICFLSVLFYSCKKNDLNQTSTITAQQVNDFYKLPAGAPPETKIVVAEMQKQLSSQNVHDFLNWHGQPIWNKVFKLTNQENNTVTYLISTNKEGNNTAFIAATIYSTGEVRLELHRKSSLLSKAKEFSYAGIDLQKSTLFLNRFDEKSIETPNTNNNAGLMPADTYCWSEYVMVPCTQTLSKNDTEQNAVAVCYAWLEHCTILIDGGGGGTGGGSGGGGNPGGGGGGTPPQCPLWYSLVPVPDDCGPPTNPPTDDPLDSNAIKQMLKKEMLDIKQKRDSIWNVAFTNDEEWHFYIKVENGVSKVKAERTDHDPDGVTPDKAFTAIGDADADYHTHQDHPTPEYRHPQDPQDVGISNGLHRKLYYRCYVDCGDAIYTIVTENLALIKTFFKTKNLRSIQSSPEWEQLENGGPNRRQIGMAAIKSLLGSSSVSGFGLYKTTNVDKTEFIKLN